MSPVERFLADFAAALTGRDAPALDALIGLPVALFADRGTFVRLDRLALGSAMRELFAGMDALGMTRVSIAIDQERPYGVSMEAARVKIIVSFADGRRSDPYNELWIMREEDGRLKLSGIVNPFRERFFETLDPKNIGE